MPPGWGVELQYVDSEGSLKVHHTGDVVDLEDFVPIPIDALPSLKLEASADCFDYELSIWEGVEGNTLTGCGTGPWVRIAGSDEWERAECLE